MKHRKNRRDFLKETGAAIASVPLFQPQGADGTNMPVRKLGKTGEQVSVIGVGGAHIGYQHVSEKEAVRIMHAAIDGGVNFFDNSWDYNGGRSEERMGKAGQWQAAESVPDDQVLLPP